MLGVCDETYGGQASACPHAVLLFFYTSRIHFLLHEMLFHEWVL
jgi:hypothetical protein